MSGSEYKPAAVAAVDMVGKEVTTHGKSPSGRFLHSSALFGGYFVVHGGRNDTLYRESLKTVALNDLHLLCLKSKTWTTVAIFTDEFPESRWGHQLVSNNDRLMLFGGMNLH